MTPEKPYFARDIAVYVRAEHGTLNSDGTVNMGFHHRVCTVNENVVNPVDAAQHIADALNFYANATACTTKGGKR